MSQRSNSKSQDAKLAERGKATGAQNRSMGSSSISPEDTRTDSIGSVSFQSLLFTQWLTAINDNAFRWLVVGIGKQMVDPGDESRILAIGLGCFVLPYLLFASIAGYLADRFSKKDVVVACKIAEILIMVLGTLAIVAGDLNALFVVVTLMGAQSALFAPAKMGSIPELLPAEKMSAANGLFGFSTVTATIIGMGIGLVLSDITEPLGQSNLFLTTTVLVGLAGVGTAISLGIRRVPAANPQCRFPWNTIAQTMRDLARLYEQRALFLVACGIVFFWSLGAMAQLNIDQFANESGAFNQSERIPLLVSLVIGVGVGSVLAGFWSAGRIELGMLSLSSFGISLFAMGLYFVSDNIFHTGQTLSGPLLLASFLLFCLGTSAGIFDVPLNAYIQHRSPAATRGSTLSAANFLIYSGILISALLFGAMRLPFHAGSLDRIPTNVYQQSIDSRAKFVLNQRLDQFRDDWSTHQSQLKQGEDVSAPAFESYLDEEDFVADPSSESWNAQSADEQATFNRQSFIAQLLWEEIKLRRVDKLTKSKATYIRRCDDHESLTEDDKMLVKLVYEQASDLPMFSSRLVFLVMGVFALPIFVFITWKLPQASARFVIWWIGLLWYRIKVRGLDHMPERRPAIMVCTRGSWFHRLLMLLITARKVRIVTWTKPSQRPLKRSWDQFWNVIHVSGGPATCQKAMAEARKSIRAGNVLAVFPEHTNQRHAEYSPEILTLCEGIQIPLVPVSIGPIDFVENNVGRSMFAIIWGLVRGAQRRVEIVIGKPFEKPEVFDHLPRIMNRMGRTMENNQSSQSSSFEAPIRKFVRRAKERKSTWKIGDSTGTSMKGGEALIRTFILRRLLNKHVLGKDEPFVGLLLPPSAGGLLANLALAMDKRVAVNLNYTASEEVMNSCIEQCGIKHVLTSKKVLAKLGYRPNAELVMLEDLRPKVTLGDKLHGLVNGSFSSPASIDRKFGLLDIKPDDLLTVIFTSGSTGTPKGVMLTQNNVVSNIASFDQALQFSSHDVLVGILPFFHSFGFTASLWGAMTLDVGVAYHFNPLDAKQVGKLCKQYKGTILMATPTFLRSYTRRCSKEEFASLEVVVAGAEKLPNDVAEEFDQKFDVCPVEGYGATELSPVACVNVPASRSKQHAEVESKLGTVGRPVPNCVVKVTDLDTGDVLGKNQPGMLWVKGPNVMKGYLHRPDLTKEVVVDGWYKTGDVALVDDDGFVQITGRMSRFSKIGGEMVPHIPVEEVLNRLLGADDEDGVPQAAVTAVPDPKKGERLIVLHRATQIGIDEMIQALKDDGLPPIGIPSPDSFIEVDEIPVLGTGKLDLKGVQEFAKNRFATS